MRSGAPGEPGVDVQAALGLREPRRHRVVAELVEPEVPAPVGQRGGRRAKRAGPVDGGRAADAPALQDADGLVGRLAGGAFLIEAGIGLALALMEIGAALQGAFLDQHDVETGSRQELGGDAAAGARADDGAVAAYFRRRRAMRAAEDLPASRQALSDRVGQLAHWSPSSAEYRSRSPVGTRAGLGAARRSPR